MGFEKGQSAEEPTDPKKSANNGILQLSDSHFAES